MKMLESNMIVKSGAVMYFSWSPRKVPKEGDLRGRYENAPPLKIPPPLRHPTSENVPIFGSLQRENLQYCEL